MTNPREISGPHQGQPVFASGAPLETARAAMVMIHGRGGTAESILALVDVIDTPGFAYLAPQASDNTWYPNSFLAPIPTNEPGISSGLQLIDEIIGSIESAGLETNRIMVLGFSQGACLSLEYAARHARRFGGVCGLSGGLIGPDDTPRDYAGTFAGTPVFLGCSDIDPHIPEKRVKETAAVLKRMKAEVTMRIYPGMGHLVNDDEIAEVKRMMTAVSG
jgi:predicted esterase